MQKSESINELATALAKARTAFKKVEKTSENPFFKSRYADLSVIIDATFKALSDNGLSVVQSAKGLCTQQPIYKPSAGDPAGLIPQGILSSVNVTTMLCHSSGQWLIDETSMPVAKLDAQAIGSATTYARRYAYQSILNIAAETDDDGNDAVSKPFPKKEKAAIPAETDPEFDERTEGQRKVSKALVDALIAFANSQGISGIPSPADLSELTRDEFEDVKKQVMARAKTPATAAAMAPVASVPVQPPKGPANGKSVSEPQLKRLFAIAKGKGVAVADVDIYIAEQYGLSSKNALSQEQYKTTISWIESQ